MYEIDGYGITLTRGDSFLFEIRLKGRVVADGCRAVFTVKGRNGETVLEKTVRVEDRKARIALLPEDTGGLQAKGYRWSLRLTDGDGNVYTPIADEVFVIGEVMA